MRLLLSFIIMMIVLVGCENKPVHQGKIGFITQIMSNESLLIGDTIYKINKDTQIKTSDGETLKEKDLKIGMKIQPFYEGEMKESFPARTEAKLLRILIDDQSSKESVMIINVIHQLRHNEDEHFIITNVVHNDSEDAYVMHVMRRSNLDIGFTITVDDDTYKIKYMEA